jgi:glycosyltransferase involved in cell wall biosynthesis
MSHLSLVIPVFNEAKNISLLYEEVVQAIPLADVQILFVDDCSTDTTPQEIAALVRKDPRVQGLRLRRNTHKSGAMQLGFAQAKGSIIITMDGDLQDSPAEIPKLLAAIEQGADVAIGWRKSRRDHANKLLPSRGINAITNLLLGQRFHDMNSGFKAYRRDVLEYISFQGSLFRFIPHLLSMQGFSVVEVPVEHRARAHGKSKFSVLHRLRSLFDVWTVFFLARFGDRPLHFFGAIGAVIFGCGIAGAVYLSVLWVQGIGVGQRPLLLVSALLMIVGVQIASVGFIGELLVHARSRGQGVPPYKSL